MSVCRKGGGVVCQLWLEERALPTPPTTSSTMASRCTIGAGAHGAVAFTSAWCSASLCWWCRWCGPVLPPPAWGLLSVLYCEARTRCSALQHANAYTTEGCSRVLVGNRADCICKVLHLDRRNVYNWVSVSNRLRLLKYFGAGQEQHSMTIVSIGK